MSNIFLRLCRQSAFPRKIGSFNPALSSVSVNYHSSLTQAHRNVELCKTSPLSTVSVRSSSGDHVKLWTAERALSAVLLGVIPAAVVMPTPAMETLLALSLTVHSHWGVEAIVHDYIRPSVFGNVIPKVSIVLVQFLSMMTFGGLCYFIYADVGIVNAVSMLWKL